MKTRKDYDRAFTVVRAHITMWDPYSLVASGAPATEFDNEIAAIVKDIPRVNCVDDMAKVISHVFCEAFGPRTFPPAGCQEVATGLFQQLRVDGLLSARIGPGKEAN